MHTYQVPRFSIILSWFSYKCRILAMSSTTNNNFSIEFDSGSISNIHTVSSNNNDNFSIEFASGSNSSRNDEAPSTSNALAAVMLWIKTPIKHQYLHHVRRILRQVRGCPFSMSRQKGGWGVGESVTKCDGG